MITKEVQQLQMTILQNELDLNVLKTNKMVAENLKKNVFDKVQTIYKNTNKSSQEIEDIAHN